MAIRSTSYLKQKFKAGSKPTAQDFEDLVDSFAPESSLIDKASTADVYKIVNNLKVGLQPTMPSDPQLSPAPDENDRLSYRAAATGLYINKGNIEVTDEDFKEFVFILIEWHGNGWIKTGVVERSSLLSEEERYLLINKSDIIKKEFLTDEVNITSDYLTAISATDVQKVNIRKLVNDIKPFYDKIIAIYPFLGSSLGDKKYNLVNPYPGREHFEMKFTPGIMIDEKGIKMPANTSEYSSTFINPLDLSDWKNCGILFYTPDNPGGSDWVIGCVPDDGSPYYNTISYHPNSGNIGSDYIEFFSDGVIYPTRRAAGFTSIRRDSTSAKININGVESTRPISNSYSQIHYSTKKWSKIALIGHPATYRVSLFAVYQGLTDNEHETLRVAIMNYLNEENKL